MRDQREVRTGTIGPADPSARRRRRAGGPLARLACAGGVLVLSAGAPARAAILADPVASRCISSPFGWRHAVGPRAPAGFHNGIDLPAPAGGVVRAAAAGRVMRIERKGIGGLQVLVAHPGGLVTIYAHLGSVVPRLAEGGTTLAAGAPIGWIGRTGVTYGTHLFFGVQAAGRAIDPNLFLRLPRCGAPQPAQGAAPPGPGDRRPPQP